MIYIDTPEGVADKARGRAVCNYYMVMNDALDEYQVSKISTGEAFIQHFGAPHAVIHRVDVHKSLLEGAVETPKVEFITSTRVERAEQDKGGVTAFCANGKTYQGQALIGAEGGKSVVRQQYVNDPARVAGHLVHYPLRGGEQHNMVVTCHGSQPQGRGVADGSNDLWKGRTPERLYDAVKWLYGWNVNHCLATN